MKLHDDGQRVTVAESEDDVWRLAYVLGLPLGSINGWKIRLTWKDSKKGIMQCHLCTRVLCTLPLPCALHRCVISSGSLPHSHITSLAYRLLFTVETHFLLCFNNSVLQPQHNISTAFICIFIYHSHHAYHLAPCWSSNDRPYYSSLSHITPYLLPSPLQGNCFFGHSELRRVSSSNGDIDDSSKLGPDHPGKIICGNGEKCDWVTGRWTPYT